MLARRRRQGAEVLRSGGIFRIPSRRVPPPPESSNGRRPAAADADILQPAASLAAPASVLAPQGRWGSRRHSAIICGASPTASIPGPGERAANDDNTDYYPVPLNAGDAAPGTVYADPYGHLLVLVKRVPQSDGAAGVFLAVDGQPDGTVARKRFWRGNFLFAQDPALGGPGFKHFRPIVRDRNGALRRLTNEEIAKNPQYGDFSLDQAKLGVEDFYDRMDDVMSPAPLDPDAGDEGGDHVARRAGEDARDLGRKRAQVPEQRPRRREHAGRRRDLRDYRRVGGFLDAFARSASADRDRRGARVSRIALRGGPSATRCRRTRASRT